MNKSLTNLDLPGYSFLSQPTIQRAGGVGMYIKNNIIIIVFDMNLLLALMKVKCYGLKSRVTEIAI